MSDQLLKAVNENAVVYQAGKHFERQKLKEVMIDNQKVLFHSDSYGAPVIERGFLHKKLVSDQTNFVVSDAASFIDSFSRIKKVYKGYDQVIKVNSDKGTIKAVFDHILSDGSGEGLERKVLTLQLEHSREWSAWSERDMRSFYQTEFAEFIEDNIDDIIEPDGAELLSIVTNLKVDKNVSFTSAKNLANGQVQISYIEQIDGQAGEKSQFIIPQEISIAVPVFKGGNLCEIRARFRYRLREGNIKLWFTLIRPWLTEENETNEIVEKVKEKIDCEWFVNVS